MERFFFRETKSDKWHWLANCPFFPDVQYPEIIKSRNFPAPENICLHCLGIEMKNFKEKNFLEKLLR